jgi:hypothetical protein
MNTYSITHEGKDNELRTIATIIENNINQQIIHPKQKQEATISVLTPG